MNLEELASGLNKLLRTHPEVNLQTTVVFDYHGTLVDLQSLRVKRAEGKTEVWLSCDETEIRDVDTIRVAPVYEKTQTPPKT